jgi:hypothetical protein
MIAGLEAEDAARSRPKLTINFEKKRTSMKIKSNVKAGIIVVC